jgi:hypothetical protein
LLDRPRLAGMLAAPFAVCLIAGCGGTATGAAVTASVTSSPNGNTGATPTTAPTTAPTATPHPATPRPPTPIVNRSNPGQFGGSWKSSNGSQLDVSGDESANAEYFIGVLCSSASPAPTPCDDDSGTPTIPGGQLKLHITEVVTTGDTAVATAEVKGSSDPKYVEGAFLHFTLKSGTMTTPFGTLTKI